MEFPIRNIVRNVPRIPNSSIRYRGGQSFWTHLYEPQLTHSHRQPSSIQATTQGFLVFIRHPEPRLKKCHLFTLYLSHNSSDIVLSQNSRNIPASLSLRYHPSLVDHAHPKQTSMLLLHYCLMLL